MGLFLLGCAGPVAPASPIQTAAIVPTVPSASPTQTAAIVPTASPSVPETIPEGVPTVLALPGQVAVPLTELTDGNYLGFSGGLYPNGQNEMPAAHLRAGQQAASQIIPRTPNGTPDPDGKYILISVGISNTRTEFCAREVSDGVSCEAASFMGQANNDPTLNHFTLALINGAQGGQTAEHWADPDSPNYVRVRNQILKPQGLDNKQVAVVWLKVADISPQISLPHPAADAYLLLGYMGEILRTLKLFYPNIQQVFVSSRIYAGYAETDINPEPYAYESGFAVKWLVEAQIRQMETGEIDPIAGNLDYNTVAPWVAWGPYLWADGLNPRADGLFWERPDFRQDGIHPNVPAQEKVAVLLLDFFKHAPMTTCWFTANHCPPISQLP